MIYEYYLWFIDIFLFNFFLLRYIFVQLFLIKENVNGFAMQYPIEGNKDFSESSSDISNLRSQSVDGTYIIEIDEETYEKFEVKYW
jgi:hypothetical protein